MRNNFAALMLLTATCAWAQQGPAQATSTQTVESLLNAENRSVYERENPPRLSARQTIGIQAIYGTVEALRADLLVGERIYQRVSVGEKAGPYIVNEIKGRCVTLASVDSPKKKTQACWTAPPVMTMTPNTTGAVAPVAPYGPLPPTLVPAPQVPQVLPR